MYKYYKCFFFLSKMVILEHIQPRAHRIKDILTDILVVSAFSPSKKVKLSRVGNNF